MDPKRLFKNFNYIKVLPLFLILMSLHSFSQTNINLALNKATSQSSTHGDAKSFRAVDGYAGGAFSDNSVTHTKPNLITANDDLHVWWQVDLGDVYEISRVEVYNRTDCCSERLDGAKIFLSTTPTYYINQQLGEPLTGSKDVQIRRIDLGKRYARYVRIQLKGNRKVLSLAEVKVFGRSPVDVPPPPQENVALGKTTSQSTTIYSSYGNATSDNAVDGNKEAPNLSDTAATEHDKTNPWWRVDLGAEYDISQIRVYKRYSCCSDYLEGAKLYVGSIDSSNPADYTQFNRPLINWDAPLISSVTTPIKGRYVMIHKQENDAELSIAEVEVYGELAVPDSTLQNIALNKDTSQSTTAYGGVSSRAVDGNTSGGYGSRTVTHTSSSDTNPWWRVDLGATYDISQIKIYNRTDCCIERLEGAKVYVGATDSNDPDDFTQVGGDLDESATQAIDLSSDIATARYVLISKNTAILSLAEVEVYGELSTLQNIALNKDTSQSTTAYGGVSSRAVDGNTSGGYGSRTVTHTSSSDTNPWWRVDLGATYDISQIKIYNRTDCCIERLEGAKVYVGATDSNDPDDFTQVGEDLDESATQAIDLSSDIATARYVLIKKNTAILSLAEVEVFGVLAANQPVPDNLATGKKTAISGEDINDEQTLKVSRFTNDKDLDTAMLLRKSDLSENDLKGGFGYYIHLDVVRNIDYIKLTTGSEMTDGAIITVINTRLKGRDQYARQWRSTNAGVETFNKNQSTVRGDAIAISFAKGEETPDDVLHIAEIEVYGTGEEDENIALYKETYQSSTHKGSVSSNAVDGDINGNGENYVSHTQLDRNPYFGIKLDGVYRINRIEVYNRTDCCRDRIQGLKTFLIPPNQFDENISSYGFKALDDSLAGEVKDVYVGDHSLSTDGNYNETSEILFRFNDDESRYLHLAEVKVFGEFIRSKPVNVALGKSTSQSSTAYGGDSARAVDGNNNGNWFENSMTHTNREDNPWWQVDLGAVHEIDYVYLYGRYDEIKELRDRIIGAQISIKEKLTDDWIVVGTIENYGPKIYDMYINLTQIAAGKKVRYMQVQIPKRSAILSISEFVAEGRLANQRSQISTRTSTSDLTNLELDSVVSLEEELSSTEGQAIQSQIVPNPNSGEFSVNYVAKQAGKVVFELYTAEGVLIHKKESRNDLKGASLSEKIIIPSNYPAGIYLLRVLFEDGDYYTLKVLKE